MLKKCILSIFALSILVSCKQSSDNVGKDLVTAKEVQETEPDYKAVGALVSPDNVLAINEMQTRYQQMEAGDTIQVRFEAPVKEVCKKKGCWMVLDLKDGKEVMVKFKDYAFFVPKDIENKTVVVQGKAYITELSQDDRRHYAEDGGKSPAEIAAITGPEKTLSFLADGVLIEQ